MAIIQMQAATGRVLELNRLLIKARSERDEKASIVRWLERELAEAVQAMNKPGAPQTPDAILAAIAAANAAANAQLSELQASLSVRQKSAVILAAHPEGLTIPALLVELRKSGWQSKSEDPANIVNSILNRSNRPFKRVGERWYHENFAPQQELDAVGPVAAPENKETTAKTAS